MSEPAIRRRYATRGQRGYAYMLVMFLLALLIISTMSAVPNVLIDGRRDKEEEMIWRGNQYKRAIRLYVSHRTNSSHRLPTSLEELSKGKPGIHFLRQAYKDPMNKKDGSWRLIYLGPSGQLIGSTRPHQQNLVIPGMPGAVPTPAGLLQNQPGNNPNGPLSMSGQSSSSGTTVPTGGDTLGKQGFSGSGLSATSDSGSPPEVPPDGVTLVGGNIIGIGSKISQKSIIWYDKAKNYREFEFVWDPAKDIAVAAQQGGGPAPAQAAGPSNPFAPPGDPGQPAPNGGSNSPQQGSGGPNPNPAPGNGNPPAPAPTGGPPPQ